MIQYLRLGGVKPENNLETKTRRVGFEVYQRGMWGVEYRQ